MLTLHHEHQSSISSPTPTTTQPRHRRGGESRAEDRPVAIAERHPVECEKDSNGDDSKNDLEKMDEFAFCPFWIEPRPGLSQIVLQKRPFLQSQLTLCRFANLRVAKPDCQTSTIGNAFLQESRSKWDS